MHSLQHQGYHQLRGTSIASRLFKIYMQTSQTDVEKYGISRFLEDRKKGQKSLSVTWNARCATFNTQHASFDLL